MIVAEEENLIVLDRSAERAAVVILNEHRYRLPGGVIEEIVGVEIAIAQVVEGVSVVLIGARARDELNLPARIAAVFCLAAVGYDARFFLGQATEPWGCPANVVRGPIQLATDTGEPFVIEDCVFFACTAGSGPTGTRTSNFGAGCIQPWSASGWNTPANIPVTVMSPLAYAAGYSFGEFDYGTADEVFNSANPQGVSEESTLRLYNDAPDGYQFLQLISGCPWMALRPKQLQIAGTTTAWPAADVTAIAMIDSGGTSVYLSDPTGLVYENVWPAPAGNPSWTSTSVNCVSTKSSLQVTLGDDQGASFTYAIDETALPTSAQGLTLVMCQMNEFMRGQYGMNIGGLSALATQIIVDYGSARVGFRPLPG